MLGELLSTASARDRGSRLKQVNKKYIGHFILTSHIYDTNSTPAHIIC